MKPLQHVFLSETMVQRSLRGDDKRCDHIADPCRIFPIQSLRQSRQHTRSETISGSGRIDHMLDLHTRNRELSLFIKQTDSVLAEGDDDLLQHLYEIVLLQSCPF